MARKKNQGEAAPGRTRQSEPLDSDAPDEEHAVLAWEHRAAEIGQSGLEVERSATPTERQAIARVLDLLAVDRLKVSYRLRPRSGGLYSLDGRLEADVRQTCVVSLEEMASHIEEPLSAEFWPAERLPVSNAPVLIDDVEGEEPLPIRDDRIETGRLVFDILALAVDPHPRKQDAAFQWKDEDGLKQGVEEASARPHPFAALAKLKKKGD